MTQRVKEYRDWFRSDITGTVVNISILKLHSFINIFMSPPRSEWRHYVLGLSVRPSVCPAVRPSVRSCIVVLRQHGSTDWIHNLYKHSTPPAKVFITKGQGHRSRSKMGLMWLRRHTIDAYASNFPSSSIIIMVVGNWPASVTKQMSRNYTG